MLISPAYLDVTGFSAIVKQVYINLFSSKPEKIGIGYKIIVSASA
jgi:hypothetical protein